MAAGSSSVRIDASTVVPSDGAERRWHAGRGRPARPACGCGRSAATRRRSRGRSAPRDDPSPGPPTGTLRPGHHPVGHGPDRMFELRRQPLSAMMLVCPLTSCATTAQQGAGIQSSAWRTSHTAHFLRIERGVGLADGLDHGVAPLEARAQRAEAYLYAARKVGAASRPDNAAGGVRLAGNWCHRSQGRGRARA